MELTVETELTAGQGSLELMEPTGSPVPLVRLVLPVRHVRSVTISRSVFS